MLAHERFEMLAATPVVAPDDPRVLRIETPIDEIGRKNREIDAKDAEIARLSRENEKLRRAAIARTLTAAAQPDASPAAIAAAAALGVGDTRPAEALLRTQEREEAAQIASPGIDEAQQRQQAAALAREQGALAMGHDVRTALEAYQRAAEYERDDYWTHFLSGDLQLRLGSSEAAMQSYRSGAAASERRVRANPNDLDGQRDLSVSHDRIGDVLVAQGDGPGALAAYREGLAIREALAARNPLNTRWQRDLCLCFALLQRHDLNNLSPSKPSTATPPLSPRESSTAVENRRWLLLRPVQPHHQDECVLRRR